MLYAHSLPGKPVNDWQPLPVHLEEVAEQAALLASVFNASALAFVIGYLHDLGKASEPGQNRQHGRGPKVDHSTAGARELMARWEKQFHREGKIMAEWLAYCIVGHHAGLPDYGRSHLEPGTLRYRLNPSRPIPDYRKGMEQMTIPSLMPDRVSVKIEPFSVAFFIRMLFSCLTDADWLNTEAFCNPLRAGQRKTDWTAIPSLAQKLEETFRRKNWLQKEDVEQWGALSLNHLPEDLPKTGRINRARKAILSWCCEAAEKPPGLFSLTVPTGGGKTASSMAFALNHAKKYGLRRVILVVPYTSIIEQNARNIREWLGDDTVLEHHSNYLHPAEKEDSNPDGTDNDHPDALEAQQFRLATENWEATVIVTTAVQFFESLFSNKPSRCRKLHNIAKSVVLFDEAQMIPVQLLKPSVLAMHELVDHYGSSLVFCTATQPALNRQNLNDPFPGFDAKAVREIVPGDQLPLLFNLFKRVEVKHLGTLTDTALAERLRSEKQVLCIVNTRKRAREVFDAAKESADEASWFHLSARMTPAHRSRILDALRERLKAGKPCRVISTSLIECGVDVSFPAVYREKSGLDAVAQAAGRCNRSGEWGESGRFYIFESEGGLPERATDLQRRAVLFDDVVKRYDDLFSPEAVGDYFRQLRYYANTDEADVVEKLCGDSITEKMDFRFNFRSAAKAYRFIDSDMIPIIVENDVEENDEAVRLVRKLEAFDSDPNLFRLLQRHTVQIYPWEVATLQRQGSLELVRERFYILRRGIGYSEKRGLVTDDPSHMEADKGIF